MCVCRCTLAARSVIAMAMHLKPCRTSSTKASERRRSLKPTTHVRTYRMHHIHSDTRTLPPPPTHTTHLTTQRCLQDIRMSACTSAHQLTFPNCTQISLEQFQETERENAEERNTWYTHWVCTCPGYVLMYALSYPSHLLNGLVNIFGQCGMFRGFVAVQTVSYT